LWLHRLHRHHRHYLGTRPFNWSYLLRLHHHRVRGHRPSGNNPLLRHHLQWWWRRMTLVQRPPLRAGRQSKGRTLLGGHRSAWGDGFQLRRHHHGLRGQRRHGLLMKHHGRRLHRVWVVRNHTFCDQNPWRYAPAACHPQLLRFCTQQQGHEKNTSWCDPCPLALACVGAVCTEPGQSRWHPNLLRCCRTWS
jgi:hypothetical protein